MKLLTDRDRFERWWARHAKRDLATIREWRRDDPYQLYPLAFAAWKAGKRDARRF